MITTTYALATASQAEVEAAMGNTVSVPPAAVRVGDVVVTGHGSLEWQAREVVAVQTDYTFGPLLCITYADGKRAAQGFDGFWFQVIRLEATARDAAAAFANAYATAWDRKVIA